MENDAVWGWRVAPEKRNCTNFEYRQPFVELLNESRLVANRPTPKG
jgi:hypothetical protein